ncbi:MAG TPA: hypothetical protein VGO66_01885, partial [Solirubrobacterales bacterium]|nr:hypothetical protein [Solirubrobacterales bacterium]
MGRARAAVGLVAVVAAGALLVSGGRDADPRTPTGLPGMPPPFLGVAVLGDGELTAAVDAYGDVVDLRRQLAGRALIENPADRQAAGSVAPNTGIQVWVRAGGAAARPLWEADSIRQRYRPGTNVLLTVARFGTGRVVVEQAVHDGKLAVVAGGDAAEVELRANEGGGELTRSSSVLVEAAAADRRWLSRARPLGPGAPAWARRMYERSLLVLHALT